MLGPLQSPLPNKPRVFSSSDYVSQEPYRRFCFWGLDLVAIHFFDVSLKDSFIDNSKLAHSEILRNRL